MRLFLVGERLVELFCMFHICSEFLGFLLVLILCRLLFFHNASASQVAKTFHVRSQN